MRPRRVLYTDFYAFVGGGQQNLLSLFGAMDRARWQPLLALPKEGPFAAAARALDVPVFISPMGKARWRLPWQAWPAMRRLRSVMARQGVDLVHANDFPSHKLAVAAARGLGLPEIYHQQIAVTQKPRSTTGRLMRFHLRHATRVLAVSRSIQRDLEVLGLPQERISLMYNNADTEALARARPVSASALRALGLDLPARGSLILAAGMRRPHKGFDVLMRAAALFFGGSGGDCRLAVLGDAANAEAGHEELLRGLAAAPELEGRAGFYPAQRPLAPWLKRCALFVSSSRWEGSPLVVLEAMAAGCAVVATRQGAGEVLEHGRTGWLVESGDAAGLAQALRHLMARPALRRSLGAAARAEAVRRFSLRAYVRDMAALYDAVAAEGPAGASGG